MRLVICYNKYMENSLNLKQLPLKGILLSVLVVIIFLVAGIFLGYQFGLRSPNSNLNMTSKAVSVTEKSIVQPQQKWGEIVVDKSIQFSLKGNIVEIKEGVIRGGESGKDFTLANKSDKATVFVPDLATIYEGNSFLDPQKWSQISTSNLKIGDNVTIRAQTPFNEYSQASTFRGWWVFKQV